MLVCIGSLSGQDGPTSSVVEGLEFAEPSHFYRWTRPLWTQRAEDDLLQKIG